MQKRFRFLLVMLLFSLPGYSQYKISGYINTDGKEITVYLSLLQYNEEVAIYPEQIIASTKTDSTGYFEIIGRLLPQMNKLYRIHSNKDENSTGFEFNEDGPAKNYHNFIFSNTDTIIFPQGSEIWFSHPQNTNKADTQWRNSIKYELKLTEEYSEAQNADAIIQAETDFLNAYKQYCNDSVSDALVKLLAYYHIKRNVSFVDEDYKNAPEFYTNLLNELNEYYSGTSYYSQFLDEISRLSVSLYKQKMLVYKRVSYSFGILSILLAAIIVFLYLKIRKVRATVNLVNDSMLTKQERKVAELISSGKSNKEIADQLFISLSTVKTHVGNIHSKLNVSNREELIQKLQNHTGY